MIQRLFCFQPLLFTEQKNFCSNLRSNQLLFQLYFSSLFYNFQIFQAANSINKLVKKMSFEYNQQQIVSFQELKEKYQISQYGFLEQHCLTELPEPFRDYQILKQNLPHAFSSKFGEVADSLIYSPEKHSFKNLNLTKKQLKFMYAFLTLSYSRYVWENGIQNPRKIIPQVIAMPFLQICEIIGIKPSIAYASQITYNWGFKTDTKQLKIQNLYCPMTMSGTRAQQWFYLIMTAIQINGGDIIVGMYNAHNLSQKKLLDLLKNIGKNLIQMKSIIKRMYDENPFQEYNEKVRPYLMGTKNIPGGVMVKDTNIIISQTGGSAAQCPLIQAINIFLRVKLRETTNEFIERNKSYMTRIQRQFLSDFQKLPSIKQKIERTQNIELIDAFNQCIDRLHQFRGAHFGVVDHYVFKHLKDQGALGTGSSHAKDFLSDMMKQTSLGKIVPDKNNNNDKRENKQKKNSNSSPPRNQITISQISIILAVLFILLKYVYNNYIESGGPNIENIKG